MKRKRKMTWYSSWDPRGSNNPRSFCPRFDGDCMQRHSNFSSIYADRCPFTVDWPHHSTSCHANFLIKPMVLSFIYLFLLYFRTTYCVRILRSAPVFLLSPTAAMSTLAIRPLCSNVPYLFPLYFPVIFRLFFLL